MIATHQYVKEKFEEFNRLIFDGKLPPLPIFMSNARTYLGACSCRKKRTWRGRIERYDFKLKITRRYDFPENELEDVIIHEMIHYYIDVNKIKDTSPHGKVFRQMMADINSKYGRHINISRNARNGELKEVVDNTERCHVVAVVTMSDGKVGIKVLPRKKSGIADYYYGAMDSGEVAEIELYACKDAYFNRFPTSSSLKVHFITVNEIIEHLKNARPLYLDFM